MPERRPDSMDLGELARYLPILLLAGLVIAVLAAWGLMKKRPTPAELERQRRELIDAVGKVGDATIVEVQPYLISYSYHAHGIEYLATQDVSALEIFLPSDRWGTVGAVSVKYDPRNPANSIVVSERWSGLRPTSSKLER